MSNTINAVKNNANHLKQLLMNQTSIVDATLNARKQDEENMKQKLNNMYNRLSEKNKIKQYCFEY